MTKGQNVGFGDGAGSASARARAERAGGGGPGGRHARRLFRGVLLVCRAGGPVFQIAIREKGIVAKPFLLGGAKGAEVWGGATWVRGDVWRAAPERGAAPGEKESGAGCGEGKTAQGLKGRMIRGAGLCSRKCVAICGGLHTNCRHGGKGEGKGKGGAWIKTDRQGGQPTTGRRRFGRALFASLSLAVSLQSAARAPRHR